MAVLAVVDVLSAVVAIGEYEHLIGVVTHGEPDVWPAAFFYELLAFVLDELDDAPGVPGDVGTARAVVWTSTLLVTLAAVAVWRYRVRGTLLPERALFGWVGATVVLKLVVAVYNGVAAPPAPSIDGVLTTRPVAYPLWTVASIALVVTALLTARTIRRTTTAYLKSREYEAAGSHG